MSASPKPCPFCGAEPTIFRRAGVFAVKCTCAGKRFVHSYGKTEESAILSWDMRHFSLPKSYIDALAAKDAELERLREALDDLADKVDRFNGIFAGTKDDIVCRYAGEMGFALGRARAALNGGSDAP